MVRKVSNPPNPWVSQHVEWLGPPPPATLRVYEETAAGIVSENDSPDVAFRFGVNPYRGCFHACAYCYARPYHQYLGWGAGTDFDTRIVVKTNAAALLAKHFARRTWKGELLGFSGITDCYQPVEASYGITRACLEVCLTHRNPVALITKGALVRRDAELLGELARVAQARVFVSIPFADRRLSGALEPHASAPEQRLDALSDLSAAGVITGVTLGPVIPGLSEDQIPEVLTRARDAGARYARLLMLRLPGEVEQVFLERLREELPLRAEHVLSAIRDVRGGKLHDGRLGHRMRGTGPRWEATRALFRQHCRRLDLDTGPVPEPPDTFRRPDPQGSLFG